MFTTDYMFTADTDLSLPLEDESLNSFRAEAGDNPGADAQIDEDLSSDDVNEFDEEEGEEVNLDEDEDEEMSLDEETADDDQEEYQIPRLRTAGSALPVFRHYSSLW